MSVLAQKAYQKYFLQAGRPAQQRAGHLVKPAGLSLGLKPSLGHPHRVAAATSKFADSDFMELVVEQEGHDADNYQQYVVTPARLEREFFSTAINEWSSDCSRVWPAMAVLEKLDVSVLGVGTVPRTTEIYDLRRKFNALCSEWKSATRLTSSSSDIVMHPAYQRIIGLGPEVIPLVLSELRDHGGHWFWALRALTGENPIDPSDVGRVKRMAHAWLEWGKARGLI